MTKAYNPRTDWANDEAATSAAFKARFPLALGYAWGYLDARATYTSLPTNIYATEFADWYAANGTDVTGPLKDAFVAFVDQNTTGGTA